MVDSQGLMGKRRAGSGIHIGKNIRTAKAVNSLLGITDEKKQGVLIVNCFKYLKLQRVGILEFVDEGGRVFPGYRAFK